MVTSNTLAAALFEALSTADQAELDILGAALRDYEKVFHRTVKSMPPLPLRLFEAVREAVEMRGAC